MFRRKRSKSSPLITRESEEAVLFGLEHPFFKNLERKNSINTLYEVDLSSIRSYITFFSYKNGVDKEFEDFLQFARLSQISQGLSLIKKIETESGAMLMADPSPPESLAPTVASLFAIRHIHAEIKRQNLIAKHIIQKMNQNIAAAYSQCKKRLACCLSLIATTAFPNNVVPVIKFDEFNMSNTARQFHNDESDALQRSFERCKTVLDEHYYQIRELTAKPPVMDHVITSYMKYYERGERVFQTQCDCVEFVDLLKHPGCLVASSMQQFCLLKTPSSYKQLILSFISAYQLEDNRNFVIALFSNVVAPMCAPELVFDGDDTGGFDNAIEFIILTDPLLLLSLVGKKVADGTITETFNALRGFSSNWRSILQFIVDFTDFDELSILLLESRNVVIENATNDLLCM